ncbi:hypothetical protein WN943_028898 [Citrus x changshan-huyou]
MQSDRSDSRGLNTQRTQSLTGSGDTRGKHRIQAELKRLEQETRFLEGSEFCCEPVAFGGLLSKVKGAEQLVLAVIGINNIVVFSWTCEFKLIGYLLVVVKEEELEQLDKTEKASAACNETLRNVEAIPDPLLPM